MSIFWHIIVVEVNTFLKPGELLWTYIVYLPKLFFNNIRDFVIWKSCPAEKFQLIENMESNDAKRDARRIRKSNIFYKNIVYLSTLLF